MTYSLRTHEYARQKNREGGTALLVRLNPYIRLRNGIEEPTIFIQGGRYYYEGGVEVKDVPLWVKDQVAKLTDTAKRDAGLK